eukprot:g41257.t1
MGVGGVERVGVGIGQFVPPTSVLSPSHAQPTPQAQSLSVLSAPLVPHNAPVTSALLTHAHSVSRVVSVPPEREPGETPNSQPTVPMTSEQGKVGTVEGSTASSQPRAMPLTLRNLVPSLSGVGKNVKCVRHGIKGCPSTAGPRAMPWHFKKCRSGGGANLKFQRLAPRPGSVSRAWQPGHSHGSSGKHKNISKQAQPPMT